MAYTEKYSKSIIVLLIFTSDIAFVYMANGACFAFIIHKFVWFMS